MKHWIMGLGISCLRGLLLALVGMALELTTKQVAILFAVSIGKEMLRFLDSNRLPCPENLQVGQKAMPKNESNNPTGVATLL